MLHHDNDSISTLLSTFNKRGENYNNMVAAVAVVVAVAVAVESMVVVEMKRIQNKITVWA